MAKKAVIKGVDQYLTAKDSEVTEHTVEDALDALQKIEKEYQVSGFHHMNSTKHGALVEIVRSVLTSKASGQKADDDHYEDESMYVDAFLDSLDNQNGWRKEKFFYDGGRGIVNDHLFDDGAPALKYFHREPSKIKVDMGHYEGIVYEMRDVKEGYYFDPALEAWIKVDLTENEDWENPSDEDEYYE